MNFSSLTAISSIDGRYRNKIEKLENYFSEFALIKYRVLVEVEYFIALCELPLPQLQNVSDEQKNKIRKIIFNFSVKDAETIKEIEQKTNHDVKAVEYFIKSKFDLIGLSGYKEFIHFGLTSQDINNTAIPMLLRDAMNAEYFISLVGIIEKLNSLSEEWKSIPMLARTHGQPASPTLLGKEFLVFVDRLNAQKKYFDQIPYSVKFGGATGNFNAHYAAYPEIDWMKFANDFVNNKLNSLTLIPLRRNGELERSQHTTQIEHYDNLAAFFDCMKRINTILVDLSRDIWTYISMDYFKQQIKKEEVGSSAMPHKVNPIDFENAEGNFGMANAIFEHLSDKLPVSRLQRDLTDSTVLRNIGVPFAHTLISFQSLLKGLNKIVLNEVAIKNDLENNWIVISEAIQTILRRENFPQPYEALKELTRQNNKIGEKEIHAFIEGLKVSDQVKIELKAITPFNYTGKI